MSIFEIVMLLCFGAAWPASICRSWKARSNRGKSLLFLGIIIVGYIAGICHKIFNNYDNVIWLYIINAIMVSIDMCLYWRNSRIDAAADAAEKPQAA